MVNQGPDQQPNEASQSDPDKCLPPSVMKQDPDHQGRRQDRPSRRAAIENAGSERALFDWKPFCHDLDACRPVPRLAGAQQELIGAQGARSARQGVQNAGARPPSHRQGKAQTCSQAIQERAGDSIGDGIGEHEREHHARIRCVAHAELVDEYRRSHGERLPIKIIDGGGEECQGNH